VHTINVKAESLTKSPSSNSTQANTNLRLPPIKLPVFNNKPTEFKHFFDTFNSLVLNNETLDNIQRYYYLLSVMTDEAHELIENLPVTADNFPIAWKLISDRYDNPRLIANAYVRALLSPPVVSKECPHTLRSLLNHCKSNVNASEALPVHELIITQLCLQKIDSNTRKDWELKSNSEQPPSLAEFLHFLEQRCHALDMMNLSTPSKASQPEGPRSSLLKNARHTYFTTNSMCPLCKKPHQVPKCKEFREATYQQRLNTIKHNDLCFICLNTGHVANSCPSDHKCRKCGKGHHTLIHYQEPRSHLDQPSDIQQRIMTCYRQQPKTIL